jgi:phosphate transport system permease protein
MNTYESSHRPPLGRLLLTSHRRSFLGIERQRAIRLFFAGNSSVAIIVLVLIMLFLLREGVDFLPTYRRELQTYRQAGLEYCDLIDRPLVQHQQLCSRLRRALSASLNTISLTARSRRDAAYQQMRDVEDETRLQRSLLAESLTMLPPASPETLRDLRQKLADSAAKAAQRLPDRPELSPEENKSLKRELAELSPEQHTPPPLFQMLSEEYLRASKEGHDRFQKLVTAVEVFESAPDSLLNLLRAGRRYALETKSLLTTPNVAGRLSGEKTEDPAERIKPLIARTLEYATLIDDYIFLAQKSAAALPDEGGTPQATALIAETRNLLPAHLETMRQVKKDLAEWRHDSPVHWWNVTGAFFLGTYWITNSSWQDFFGFVPLFVGSLAIAIVAVLLATPVSVVAAIYTSHFAGPREQAFIKPVIEFIQAIPSIVLGFIGISILGDMIKNISHWEWLQWIPGFPIQERLNMFNAACLLAFMAVPTMYSLAEDALNNVPRANIDASEALGATKLQTVFRVIVPAAMSGIAAAILLGLGRVIGETMVVLLVAGNRIATPDFSAGPGVIFQPAHTLTGIIAQELGEVSRGSAHWQALFMVGIVLFVISLLMNRCARAFLRRLELPKA